MSGPGTIKCYAEMRDDSIDYAASALLLFPEKDPIWPAGAAAEDMGCHKKKMSGYNRVSAKPTTKYQDKADKEHYDSQSVPTYEANLTRKQNIQSPNNTF